MIDLRSDTVTQPTQEMRDAMYTCEVGDDVYGDDPTVNRLEALAAKMLGKEAALFVSSGTMGNQLALMSMTKRGDEVILSKACHIFEHEAGAAAVLSAANQNQLEFVNGIYDADKIERAIRPAGDIHQPHTALICVENALAGGRVVPLEVMKKVYAVGVKHHIPVHLDGARVFNAAAALSVPVTELTKCADTVSCCLSKGLCAPVGAVLAGPKDTIDRARGNRKILGGGMRQAGFLAAAGIVALTEMTKRLSEDHENARAMAEALKKIDGVTLDMNSVQINMVFFTVDRDEETLTQLPEKMREKGVLINPGENKVFRFVTHHGVSKEDALRAVALFKEAIA